MNEERIEEEEFQRLCKKWGFVKEKGFCIREEMIPESDRDWYFLEDSRAEVVHDCEYWSSEEWEQVFEERDDIEEWLLDMEEDDKTEVKTNGNNRHDRRE